MPTRSEEVDPRRLIVTACQALERAGQADMVWGHVSIRDPGGRGVWIKGSHLGFDEVGTDDVILLAWDGEILEGDAGRHLEYPIHTEIIARRSDVNAVVHTHPIHSIAFAATNWPLKPLSHDGVHFVPPDIPRFTKTGNLIATAELGQDLADALADRQGILMPRHGITTVGEDIAAAVGAAICLERACQIALLAGENADPGPEEEAIEKRAAWGPKHLKAPWDYLARAVERDRAAARAE